MLAGRLAGSTRACSPRWWAGAGWLLAIVVALAACHARPPEVRPDVDALTQQIRAMPGVQSASNEVADSVAQGLIYLRVYVDVADDITADQLADITSRYLRFLDTVNHTGYRAELDARRGWNVFAVDSGTLPIANDAQIIQQARDWAGLRRAFGGATVTLRATITHPGGQMPVQEWGHSSIGAIELPDAADYTAVSAAATTMGAAFPQLAELDWTISAGNQHPAEIRTAGRFPTAQEIVVWNRLNADQSIPHVDRLRIDRPFTAPVWVSEKTTQTRDVNVAIQLARQHLPIVATMRPPVLYTASDQLLGHIGFQGHATGPVAVTVGGCTIRELWLYRPTPAEQALINTYEKCHA